MCCARACVCVCRIDEEPAVHPSPPPLSPFLPRNPFLLTPPPSCVDANTQVVFPGHVPEDVHEVPINIDMTPVVKGEKGDGRVLVDSANKTYFAN